jgi:hypothetical protein
MCVCLSATARRRDLLHFGLFACSKKKDTHRLQRFGTERNDGWSDDDAGSVMALTR